MGSNLKGSVLGLFFLVGCGGAAVVPTPADPGVVTVDGTLATGVLHASQQEEIVARVRVHAGSLAHMPRPPIHLALVVDTSGSMDGQPITDARNASLALVDGLANGDRLSVTTFDTEARVLVEDVVLDDHTRADAKTKIATMVAHGTTDMAGGLQLALQQLLSHEDGGATKRIVLLGDGVPNDASQIPSLAQLAAERGAPITALGLGLDYDETLMGQIAQLSGGRFHYVEHSAAVAQVFHDEVLRLQRVVGRSAVVTLLPGPGVRIQSVIGQNVTQNGAQVYVTLGDLAEGETRDLIVRASAPPHRVGAVVELFDAKLSFADALVGAGQLERRLYVSARTSTNETEIAASRNPEVEQEAARMQAAAVTVQAIALARGGEIDQARAQLDAAIVEARRQAAASNDQQLDAYATGMASLQGALPSVAPARPESPPPSSADAATVRSMHYEAEEAISAPRNKAT